MPVGEDVEAGVGAHLLAQISNEMVRAQKTFFGRGPEKAKSYLLDDFLLIIMRGGFLPAERTMLDGGKQDVVRQFRQDFENEMTGRLIATMEGLTGRRILTRQSQVLFDPDIVVEIFFFDRPLPAPGIEETLGSQALGLAIADAVRGA